jgi:hypothetical protein
MSWWLPVLYVCLTNGVCTFAHGPMQDTKEQCVTLLHGARDEMDAHPQVQEHDGACLEVKPGKSA